MKQLAILAAFALTACAPMLQAGGLQPMDQWRRLDTPWEVQEKDKRECAYDVQKYARRSGNDFIDLAERNKTMRMCMETRGYTGGYSQ